MWVGAGAVRNASHMCLACRLLRQAHTQRQQCACELRCLQPHTQRGAAGSQAQMMAQAGVRCAPTWLLPGGGPLWAGRILWGVMPGPALPGAAPLPTDMPRGGAPKAAGWPGATCGPGWCPCQALEATAAGWSACTHPSGRGGLASGGGAAAAAAAELGAGTCSRCRLPSEGLFRDAEQYVCLACTCKPRFLQSMSTGWPMQLNSRWRPVQLSWKTQRRASCTVVAGTCHRLTHWLRQDRWHLPQAHVCRGSAACLQRLWVLREGLELLQKWWLGGFHRGTAPDLRATLLPPAIRLPALYLGGLPLSRQIPASLSRKGCCCLVWKGARPRLPLMPHSRDPVPHDRLPLLPDGSLCLRPLPVSHSWHCLPLGMLLSLQRWLPGRGASLALAEHVMQHSLLLLQRHPLGLGLAIKAPHVFAQAHQEHAALGQGPLAAACPSSCGTLQDRGTWLSAVARWHASGPSPAAGEQGNGYSGLLA